MNRQKLAKLLAKNAKLNVAQAEKIITAFGDTVSDALGLGEKIVYSNFGTFYTVHYPSKVIYHPILGAAKKMVMLPTDVVKWMPADNIKSMVDAGRELESATSFGASKKFEELRTLEGIPSKKAIELPGNPGEIEIPIRRNVTKPVIEATPKIDVFVQETPVIDDVPDAEYHTSSSKITLAPAEANATELKQATDESKLKENSNFWNSLFKRASGQKKSPEDADKDAKPANAKPEKVSLIDSGIFGKSGSGTIADLNTHTPKPVTPKTVPLETAPVKAEESVSAPSSDKITFTYGDTPNLSKNAAPVTDAEKEIIPEGFHDPIEPENSIPAIGRKTKISYLDLSKITVTKELLQKIPEKIAREYRIVPVEENENELIVGMIDPEDIEAIEIVKKTVGKKVTPRLVTESDISHILDQYQGFESEVAKAIEDVSTEKGETKSEEKEELAAGISDGAPAARIVGSLLKRAIRDKASDIHIEPTDHEVIVRFRIDGVLHKKVILPKDIKSAVVSRIKILSNLKIDEQRLPQDGRFSITVDDRRVDFRVSTMPIANGEKVVMRVLDKLTGILSIENLGLRERDLSIINSSCTKSHGMILVTGPTGSGKTTTLYALISKIYSEGINIITLEDPIEYQIPGINQSQVNSDIDYTFASGLRSILRQDPDVVMIGEIRDNETAEMAVHAALTGHVVLSTLHTNDSAGAIPRLIDMKLEPFLLNSSLNVVVGQRLARHICESCKEKIKVEESEMKSIQAELAKLPESEKKGLPSTLTFYQGKGCKDCNDTGYKGRIGLYEVLEVTPKVKDLASKKSSGSDIRECAISEGMTTMIQDGILKAIAGTTTIEEVWRVTKE